MENPWKKIEYKVDKYALQEDTHVMELPTGLIIRTRGWGPGSSTVSTVFVPGLSLSKDKDGNYTFTKQVSKKKL